MTFLISLKKKGKENFIQIYFFALFILLLFIYWPSFFYPPRSDHWPALYFFHRIDMLAGPQAWKYILTHDPLINVTFRPLSFLILYLLHLVFGAEFVYINFIVFLLYYISILLIYKLASNFCESKILTIAFISVFAFLFSHFDLICWSFQYHIMLSFCLFLSGILLYINFLRTGRKILLPGVALLFFTGMLLYEAYLFWPLSIIILSQIKSLVNKERLGKINLPRIYLSVTGFIYISYGLFLFIDRMIKVHRGGEVWSDILFSAGIIISNVFTALFSLFYNNFLINLFPQIVHPLRIGENLEMGGLIVSYQLLFEKFIFLGGVMVMLAILAMIIYLFRKKLFEAGKVFLFFTFLILTELIMLFHLRYLINNRLYNLTQFRFQLIPNALFIMIVLFLIDRVLNPSKLKKVFIIFILFFILLINIQTTRRGILLLNTQLAPLQKLIFNIKTAIKTGLINEGNKLYLDDNIAKNFSPLCWNREMGVRCMRGTYQWLFFKNIKYFSTFADAKWVINEKDLSIISK